MTIDGHLKKRFGAIAIQSRFVTKDQMIEAMTVQIEDETEGMQPKLIGSILQQAGFMTLEQVDQVIETMDRPNVPECPVCGTLALQCSNCGAHIR